MKERIKEHDRDIRLARTQTSAVSDRPTKLGAFSFGTRLIKFIDEGIHWYTRGDKKAIHLRPHPNNINRDSGI